MEKRLSYVQELPLGVPKMKTQFDAKPEQGKEQGYVNGGCLVSFTEELTGQNRSDILNALNFAQLAADCKYQRESNTKEWYGLYKEVLSQLGFEIEDFKFAKYDGPKKNFQMDVEVLKIIGAAATPKELAVLKSTMDAMGKMSDSDHRLILFSSHSSGNSKGGNFQLAPCIVVPNGDLVLTIGAFHYNETSVTHGHHHHHSFLHFHHHHSFHFDIVDMYWGVQRVTLKTEAYSQFRETVIKKLGESAFEFVLNIPLKE